MAAGKACAGWFNLEFGMRIKHFLLTPLAFAAIGASALAQDTAKPAEEPLPDAPQATAAVQIQPNGPTVVMDTSMGRITCHLFQKEAPKTVENFIALAEGKKDWTDPKTQQKMHNKPLYDGTVFHRVIPDFMIQGGDPAGNGMGGPGYQFEDETRGSPHKFDKAGKLAMANAGPNTNGSQFFITVAPTTWLTGKHTIFGEVVEGHDVVNKITSLPRNSQDRPKKDVTVNSVKIERT